MTDASPPSPGSPTGETVHSGPATLSAPQWQRKASPAAPDAQRVTVVNIDVPFDRLVVFFVKAGLAALPAALILGVIGFLAAGLFTAVMLAGK